MNPKEKKIKILMIKKDITNKELALLAGCDKSFVSQLIKGRRKGKREKAKHVQRVIAMVLDVPIESIFPNHRHAA